MGIKAGKSALDLGKSKNIVQRTRDALGDIGNRLKKNPGALGGKANASSAVTKKSEFAVPRPPRAFAKPKTRAVEAKVQSGLRKQVGNTVTDAGIPATLKQEIAQTVEVCKTKDVKTDIVPEVIQEDKENVATEKSYALSLHTDVVTSEGEGETQNEYNPKLSTDAIIEAFSTDRLNVIDIDVDESNPLLVQVYIKEIYDYVFALEVIMLFT